MGKIEEFLNHRYDFGFGFGDGSGDGSGYGFRNGGGGNGSSNGSGDGSGDGSGYGSGDGDGNGSGDGNDEGIKKVNGFAVYMVDSIPTVFYSIHKNVAKGAIFENDFTFRPCYIVKGRGYFAHGETLKEAMRDLEAKIFEDLDVGERIEAFKKEFELGKKYPAMKFYEWHNKLTGSCEMGRKSFAKNHDIDLEKDEFTVEEFVEITKNDFGRDVIRQLSEELGL